MLRKQHGWHSQQEGRTGSMLNSHRRGGKVCLGWLLTPAKLHPCKVAEASWQAWLWCYYLQCDFWYGKLGTHLSLHGRFLECVWINHFVLWKFEFVCHPTSSKVFWQFSPKYMMWLLQEAFPLFGYASSPMKEVQNLQTNSVFLRQD